jgi:hypothetical protein
MAGTTKPLTVPFLIIAYNQRVIFSVDDGKGTSTLPIFTDAVIAEKYRRYFARKHKLKLQVCIADKLENGLNLLECAVLACKTLKYAVINPLPPTAKAIQPPMKPIQSIITSLLSQYRRSRKVRTPRSPRKK